MSSICKFLLLFFSALQLFPDISSGILPILIWHLSAIFFYHLLFISSHFPNFTFKSLLFIMIYTIPLLVLFVLCAIYFLWPWLAKDASIYLPNKFYSLEICLRWFLLYYRITLKGRWFSHNMTRQVFWEMHFSIRKRPWITIMRYAISLHFKAPDSCHFHDLSVICNCKVDKSTFIYIAYRWTCLVIFCILICCLFRFCLFTKSFGRCNSIDFSVKFFTLKPEFSLCEIKYITV